MLGSFIFKQELTLHVLHIILGLYVLIIYQKKQVQGSSRIKLLQFLR